MAASLKKILIAILLLVLAVSGAWWWLGRPAVPVTPPDDASAPVRGGELVASLRSEPANYNRYFSATAAADLIMLLTQARLVRVNRSNDQLEPGLAESWTSSPDGLTHTLKLRSDARFSDGTPLTSADALFSLTAAYDAPESVLADALRIAGKPITATAPDASTLVLTLPAPFTPGVRILDNLPILPRHKLEAAFKAGTMRDQWTPGRPVSEVVGAGPFVLAEHVSAQRMVFRRNPHYWGRDAANAPLPYLDAITVLIIPDQSAEALRFESGALDLMSNGDIRADDYARFRRLAGEGQMRLIEVGTALDADLLWFNLKPPAQGDAKAWLRTREFRQALSYAADRPAIANAVFLGEAVPIHGPVTPGNKTWYSPTMPTYPHDPARARQLLAAAGVSDKNGDGMLDDAAGRPVRFSMLVQQAHTTRERTATVLQEQFRRVGVAVDVVAVDVQSIFANWQRGDYDSIFHGFQASQTDPATSLDFWLSSGGVHVWNPQQPAPATPWEKQIDDLMQRQVAAPTLEERQRLFAEVQRIFGEELPALYFVAPKVTLAVSPRVRNPRPALLAPQLLWSAETLAVSGPRP